jgi:hypothetical protein
MKMRVKIKELFQIANMVGIAHISMVGIFTVGDKVERLKRRSAIF